MGFETPESVAQELKLFTENDGDIYRQQTTSILKNLATKAAKGIYKHEGGAKLFMYLTETGARKYAREFGGNEAGWHEIFPIAIRRLVADEWATEFETEYKLGSYDNLLPKKYQTEEVEKRARQQEKRLATNRFYVGQRVELHPGLDAWMRGDKYGEIAKIGSEKIHVKMDKSHRTLRIAPDRLTVI